MALPGRGHGEIMGEDISEETVKEKTGKFSAEWFSMLDKNKTIKKEPSEITKFLKSKHKVKDIWAKAIAGKYLKK